MVSGVGWDVAEWEGCGRVRGTRCEGGVGVYGKFVARSFGRSMVVMMEVNREGIYYSNRVIRGSLRSISHSSPRFRDFRSVNGIEFRYDGGVWRAFGVGGRYEGGVG